MKKRNSLLWFYAITGLLFDILISLIVNNHLYKTIFADLFYLAEFLFISQYYRQNSGGTINKYFKYIVVSIPLLFIGYNLIKTDFQHLSLGFSLSAAVFFYLVYIVYSIYGFYTIVKEQKIIFIEKSSFFWANVAFLIYGSGMFILILFYDFLEVTDLALLNHLWQPITCSINILEYLVLTLALTSKNP
jgi:hypothetical protein